MLLTASSSASGPIINVPITVRVFVITYGNMEDPGLILDWHEGEYINLGFDEDAIDFRTQHLMKYINNSTKVLNYMVYRDNFRNALPPYGSDLNFDYAAMYEEFGLCNLIKENKIDEIWVWEPGNGFASEWITSRFSNSTGNPLSNNMPPYCGKTITVLNFNYKRGSDVALETFGHRIEGAMLVYHFNEFGFSYLNYNIPYSFTTRPSKETRYVGNCGNIHFPPNMALDNPDEYIYDSKGFGFSTCNSWTPYGVGDAELLNCEEWGCNEQGFVMWWMNHIPRYWWKDLFK